MKKEIDYNLHNIITIKIVQTKKSLFDYRMYSLFRHYEVDKSLDSPDLRIIIGRFKPNKENTYTVDKKYYIKQGYIYYKSRYKAGYWEVEINGLHEEQTVVKANWDHLGSLMGPGIILSALVKLKLVSKGFVLLHGSAVNNIKGGCLMMARSGVGKTVLMLRLIKDGFKLLGDDKNILGKGKLFSLALPIHIKFTYNSDKIVKLALKDKLQLKFKKFIYFLSGGFLNILTPIEIKRIFPDSLCEDTRLIKILELFQGSEIKIVKSTDSEEIAMRAVYNAQFESEELDRIILAYSSIFPKSKISRFWDEFKRIILANIKNANRYKVFLPKFIDEETYQSVRKLIEK